MVHGGGGMMPYGTALLDIDSTNTQINVVQRYYKDRKFAIGISMEKLGSATFTSFNTKASDLLTLNLKGANDKISLDATDTRTLFNALDYDAVLSIGDVGVSVLEHTETKNKKQKQIHNNIYGASL